MNSYRLKTFANSPQKNSTLFFSAACVFSCILVSGLTLFTYIEKQNKVTELRLAIPTLAKEVKLLNEETIRLRFEIERFESPIHLMELMRKPEFSHLKFPYLKDQIFLPKSTPNISLKLAFRTPYPTEP